jgi:AcrR family transcriptional regulator
MRLSPQESAARLNSAKPARRGRGRPPLTAADLEARRGRVIEEAYRLFSRDGFANTTLEAIGKGAGITKRAIYDLIGDKQTLFEMVCSSRYTVGRHFVLKLPVAGRPVRDILVDAARRLVEHSFSPDVIGIQRAVVTESGRYPEWVREVTARGKAQMFSAFAAVFQDMVAEQMITADPLHASEVFFDVVVGARGFRAALGLTDRHPDDEDIQERVDMFLHGYLYRKCRAHL